MSGTGRTSGGRGYADCAALAAVLCLLSGIVAAAAPAAGVEADAASIEACLNDPSPGGRDPRECGERIVRRCVADGNAGQATPLACEKRRGDAWSLIARQAYRQLETKLGEAERHLLRTSQVQFELELRDLCMATRAVAGGDPDLSAASCASDLLASRALILSRLAAGRGATAR